MADRIIAGVAFPDISDPPSSDGERKLRSALSSLSLGGSAAIYPWIYYEAIDSYLGPWGPSGYPIGYGKKYCVLFNTSLKLDGSEEAKKWVYSTTRNLQDSITNYILMQYRIGNLNKITKESLKDAAFESHVSSYLKGGMTRVVVNAPVAVAIIATIPLEEFWGSDFVATWKQAIITAGGVMLQIAASPAVTAAVLLAPVHSGYLARARQRDAQAEWGELRDFTAAKIRNWNRLLTSGKLEGMVALTELRREIILIENRDMKYTGILELRLKTEQKLHELCELYKDLERDTPEIGRWLDLKFSGWRKY